MTTFPVTLTRKSAWNLQQAITPGVPLGTNMVGTPVHLWQACAHGLRQKVNNTILRFEDEPETETVEIEITSEEGWLLDQNVPVGGDGGADILIQVFRGLWGLEHPSIPNRLVPEPPLPPKDLIRDLLDTRWNP